MSDAPDAGVIRICAVTPVFNRRDLTVDSLKSLFSSDLQNISLHVIVVDDGSSDGTSDAVSHAFPQVEIMRGDGSLWYSEGTNVGIRAAFRHNPDYILLFNDDSLFGKSTLLDLLGCATRFPTSLVGAAILDWDEPERVFQVGPVWQTLYGGWRHWTRQTVKDLPSAPFPVETIVGNCVLIPAEAFRACGLMKSAELPNFGDAELTARMRKHGWRLLIEPRAQILCQPNAQPRRLSSMTPREIYKSVWADRTHYHNLRQRFSGNIHGAPTPIQGVLANFAFSFRLGLKAAGLAGKWPNDLPERPLGKMLPPMPAPGPDGAKTGDGRTIVYAWPYVEWGGIQTYMLNLTLAAKDLGYRVAAVLPEATDPEKLRLVAAHCDQVWTFSGARDLKTANSVWRKFKRRQAGRDADRNLAAAIMDNAPAGALIHVDAGPWDSLRLLRALLQRFPVMVTVHTGLPRHGLLRRKMWRRSFSRFMASPQFRLVAANGEARRSLAPYVDLNHLDFVPVSPSNFNPAGIDAAIASAAERPGYFLRRLGLPEIGIRLFVGAQLVERKGFRDLVGALERLREAGLDIDCLWLSPSPPEPDVLAILAPAIEGGQLHVRSQSDLGGRHEDYLACLAELADIFVLPSLLEGLPLAIIEAMAIGIPVVSTRINAIPEAVIHGRNGLLVEPGDVEALAGAIEALAGDPELRRRFGSEGRLIACSDYTLSKAAEATLAAYLDLGQEVSD